MPTFDFGCGSKKVDNSIGLDTRRRKGVDIVADIQTVPLRTEIADGIYCQQVLESFSNPYVVLREMHRVLKAKGTAYISVPNYGTASAVLDPTHKFIADLKIWKNMLDGFFKKVKTDPYGVRFRSVTQKWLEFQAELINDGFYDLAQGFIFTCKGKRNHIEFRYVPWFLEEQVERMQKEVVL